jgi:hypothetical protein
MPPVSQRIFLLILHFSLILHLVQAVVNQIDVHNVSGYDDQPACSQDCLYCCHDVAWQSSCYTNECFCLASSFSDRLRYVEYCVSIQCQGNVDDVLAATNIVKITAQIPCGRAFIQPLPTLMRLNQPQHLKSPSQLASYLNPLSL